MQDLVREASEARGRYSDASREVGRPESDLATVQDALRASEEEMLASGQQCVRYAKGFHFLFLKWL
jgi:hypothetical protein